MMKTNFAKEKSEYSHRLNDVVCPKCGNEFKTKLIKNIQCGKIMVNGKRCGKRFDYS